jgi:8-amino-7-oxononanoate synthase
VKPERALTGKAREQLFLRVEAMQQKHRLQSTGATADQEPSEARLTDFSTLPGYDELRLHRSIGEKLGLDNPYFRLHEGLAGARTIVDGQELLNFSCYDYLGLNGHPEVVDAAKAAIDRYGISASASRHVAGERPAHRSLERALAKHYQVNDALVFVSGYATNVSVIGQLLGPKDLVVADAAIHNSAVMGGVLSGAARRNFMHNDLDALEALLASSRQKFERVLIVVEGLYSMDGDFPDLPRLIELKKRYHAWLMIDEAHALGVLGRRGLGIAEHFGIDPAEVDIWMGTLSKTLAACGGYIAGSAVMVEYLRCMAGAFVYSVGMPPTIAACAEKALEILHREPDRVERLQKNARTFHDHARRIGLNTGQGSSASAIAPVIVGDSIAAVLLSQDLFRKGINVQPVLYPAVPAKSARLRFFLTAKHSENDIKTAADMTLAGLGRVADHLRLLKAPF